MKIRNTKQQQANIKPEHGMSSNHTTFASLAMSPDGTRMESRLKDCKGQVRSRVKQIKQLEAMISKLKSKSNEVKTKIPLEINGKPGTIQGILGKIMNKVKDENAGSSDEKKRKKEVRDQIVISLLNDSLNDKERIASTTWMRHACLSKAFKRKLRSTSSESLGKTSRYGFLQRYFR
jgi:hypothetical protein